MSADDEEYRVIEEGRLRVYRDGRVFNNENEKFLKPYMSSYGSMLVFFPHIRKQKNLKKLVFETFVEETKSTVMNIDGNPANCHVDNLYLLGKYSRDLINTKMKLYDSAIYSTPPQMFSRYIANRDGEILNIVTGNPIKGSLDEYGYVYGVLIGDDDKPYSVKHHRFVVWCFDANFDFWNEKELVNHMDTIRHNNKLTNLEIVTHLENNLHMIANNPCKGTNSSKTATKQVEALNNNGGITMFMNAKAAAMSVNANVNTLYAYIRSGLVYKGFTFRYYFEDIPGELWYKIKHVDLPDWAPKGIQNLGGLYVSDAARIVTKNGTMFKCKRNSAGYQQLLHQRAGKAAHQIICFAFHGIPPSEEHTVDHLHRETTNDKPNMLSWKTKEQQNANSSKARAVQVTNMLTGEITKCLTRASASKVSGVSVSRLSSLCKTGRQSRTGFAFEYIEVPLQEICNCKVLGHPDITSAVSYETVRQLCRHAGRMH